MNSYGVSVRVNAIKSVWGGTPSIPGSLRIREAIEKCRSAKSFINYITSSDRTTSCNLLVSDSLRIFALEVIPWRLKKFEITDKIAMSNTFVSQPFQKYLLSKTYSKKRQLQSNILINKIMYII